MEIHVLQFICCVSFHYYRIRQMTHCTFFVPNIVVFCVFKSSATEEKPVPKKLGLTMFAAFEKSDLTSDVKLRRAKSEKKVRPKSVGNVDLLLWKDDGIIPSSSGSSKKEKTGSLPRPKSIAF